MQFKEMRILARVPRRVLLRPSVLAVLVRHVQVLGLEIPVLICDLKTRDRHGLKRAYSVDKAVRGFVSQRKTGEEFIRHRERSEGEITCQVTLDVASVCGA